MRAGRELELGGVRHDLTHRALVMGILNRTPDSFFDKGSHFDLAAMVDRAARLVADGADILDVGGVKAGPGPEVGLEEEIERVVPAVEALRSRFSTPVSVDTWKAKVASLSYDAGAVMGNDISGFQDPDYLPVAAAAGAAVVATHIRLGPRIPDPEPDYDDVVGDVASALADMGRAAQEAGVPAARVVVDAGLDLGKTWQQSVALLRAGSRLAALGYPLLLSASNKTFLGKLLDLEVGERREATMAACAIGVMRGARILRVHDVKGARRVRDALEAVMATP
ncbi:MAG TPA: dihydropteroate synthase [Acidimicrobiales bacterium]|nr:dihydropteroate synthase [Acidimicrobiales bacterium]